MACQEVGDRFRAWDPRAALGQGVDENEEFFGGTDREPVIRLGHDIGVDPAGQVELGRHASRAGKRVAVGYGGDASEVGEPDRYRRRGVLEMGSTETEAAVAAGLKVPAQTMPFA